MSKPEDPKVAPANPIGAVPTADNTDAQEMTEKQAALLRRLCEKAGEPFDGNLTRRQAKERIDALREQLGED